MPNKRECVCGGDVKCFSHMGIAGKIKLANMNGGKN